MVKEISLGYARFILTNHPVKFESLYNTYFGSSACVILYITLRLVRFIKRLFPSEISISVTVRVQRSSFPNNRNMKATFGYTLHFCFE